MTGRLGAAGMLGSPPGHADPLRPTAAELRRAALFPHGNEGQGFGLLFGPNVDHATRAVLPDDGRIAGEEFLAYADEGGKGRRNVAMLLQVPDDRVVVSRAGIERRGSGRTLLDYFTFGNLYQPCAVLAVPDLPLCKRVEFAANRCASLREKGLLSADTPDGQAREALERMRAYG